MKKLVGIAIPLMGGLCTYAQQNSFTAYNDGMALTVSEGITVAINGNFVSQANGVDGAIDNQGTLAVSGDWSNNNNTENVFSTSAGTVKLTGTGAQTVGGTTPTAFYNLHVNNSASAGIILSGPVEVTSILTLTDGVVHTSEDNVLTIAAGGSSTEGSNASHVDGPMRKTGNTAFVFPIGDGGKRMRLGISAPSSSSTFVAQYVASSYSNVSTMSASVTPVLNNVSKFEYWDLDRVSGSGNVLLTLYWENAAQSDIDDCTDLRIAHWNGYEWENVYDATTSVSGSCSGTSSGSISTTSIITSFSPFTFGSKSAVLNPLPIELLDFSARLNEDHVVLQWLTASEIDNDYFTIEKSVDGMVYEEVTKVAGAGTSMSTQNYQALDEEPYTGVSYYRLKQTDMNGEFEYSAVETVTYLKPSVSRVYPNPVTDRQLHIDMVGSEGQQLELILYSQLGVMAFTTTIVQDEGFTSRVIDLPASISPGVYFMTLGNGNQQAECHTLVIR